MRHKKLIALFAFLALLATFVFAACNMVHPVQFNWNCNDADPVFQNFTRGSVVEFPTPITREGYLFDGWFTDKQCTAKAPQQTVVDKNTPSAYYAKWIALPKLLSATLNVQPFVGDSISKDNVSATVTYWDGTQKQLQPTLLTVDLQNATQTVGEKQIAVSYTENSTTVQCNLQFSVSAVEMQSIVASFTGNQPIVGQSISKAHFSVTALFNNGDQQPVTDFQIDGYDATKVGEQTLTISYQQKTTTVTITVLPKTLQSLSATVSTQTPIYVGDKLQASHFSVTATYDNGDVQPVTDFQIDGYDATKVGEQTLTIIYQQKTTTVTITVLPKTLQSLSATVSTQTPIYVGDKLQASHFSVTATYDNGDVQPVTDFQIDGYDATKVGEQTLTIIYQQKTTTVTITVLPWQLMSINATYSGTVLVGEQLDVAKLTVTAIYQNAATRVVQSYNTSVLDTSTPGVKTLEISYTENGTTKSCQIQITVTQSGVIANSNLSIHFLELGNQYTGDSVYIKAGDTDILIDAGSRKGSAATIGNYVDNYCTDGVLEYVIATHAHQDHIAGFVGTANAKGIFQRYECKNIIEFARSDSTTQIYKDYQTARDAEVQAGANCYTAMDCINNANGAQKTYDLTGDGSITMEVLYQKYYDNKSSDENNYSVCVLITQGENNYLFTGDLEKEGEASLVQCNPNLPEVVLFKGGHHGSYTSSSAVLLSKIKPQYVCVCCCAGTTEYTNGKVGPHTFPAQEFVDRIAKYTDNVYVTTLAVLDSSGKLKGYTSMNGNIVFSCINGQISLDCSNNNTKLKDTEWFKNNRTCPAEWASDN